MSNSTVADIIESFARRRPSDAVMLRLARVMTLVWAILMAIFAMGFSTTTGNVYLTGLAIAGYTYGALLGAFLLGKLVPRAAELDAILHHHAMLLSIAMDLLAFEWRSERLSRQLDALDGMGEPSARLEEIYADLAADQRVAG